MSKYVVNHRGRALEIVDENLAPDLLRQGFIEITKAQYQQRSYYPEYDRGPSHQVKPAIRQEIPEITSSTKERTEFQTTVV